MLIGSTPAAIITTTPVMIVVMQGVRNRGWTLATTAGSRPSFDIEKKMRGWPRSITRITELRPGDCAELHEGREPPDADRVDADGDRVGDVEQLVVDDAGQDERHQDIEDRADDQRAEDADRHVALGVLASCAAVETASKPM